MSRDERELSPEALGRLNFEDELALLRMRILRLAKAPEEESSVERARLLLGMLEALARLGNLQARVERVADGGAGLLKEEWWSSADGESYTDGESYADGESS
jgi:hypothetical protein